MGLLSAHVSEWARIGAPAFLLEWIKHGVPLDFQETPPHLYQGNRAHSPKAKQFVSLEIKRLCEAGHLHPSQVKPRCLLALQTTPKKRWGYRLVTNCRPVNKFLRVPSFSQGGIKEVVELIQPQDQLATIDLRDGFFHIAVDPRFIKFLGIKWQGQYFCWQVLPFGLAVSLYFFP